MRGSTWKETNEGTIKTQEDVAGGGGHAATCQQREDINFMCSQELAISKRDI